MSRAGPSGVGISVRRRVLTRATPGRTASRAASSGVKPGRTPERRLAGAEVAER